VVALGLIVVLASVGVLGLMVAVGAELELLVEAI
jgi:hypothetical protein